MKTFQIRIWNIALNNLLHSEKRILTLVWLYAVEWGMIWRTGPIIVCLVLKLYF